VENEYEKLRTKLYNSEYRRLIRIDKKYNGDRVKIREELGFDMPVRAKRQRQLKTKEGIDSRSNPVGNTQDNNATNDHTNTESSSAEVKSTCAPSSASKEVAEVSVTESSDASSTKNTVSTNLTGTDVTGDICESKQQSSGGTSIAEKESNGAGVSITDSVPESAPLTSTTDGSPRNTVANASMFFGNDKGSHMLTTQTRTLGNDTIAIA